MNTGGRAAWKPTWLDEHFIRVVNKLYEDRKIKEDWTQEEMARRMATYRGRNTTKQAAAGVLKGFTQPTLALAQEMAHIFNVPYTAFLIPEVKTTMDEELALVYDKLTGEQKKTLLYVAKSFDEANAKEQYQRILEQNQDNGMSDDGDEDDEPLENEQPQTTMA